MNYQEANAILSGRKSRKIGNNTYLELIDYTDGEGNKQPAIGLRLHDTHVIVYHPNHVTLWSGGWRTVTTKERLNRYAPCRVDQVNSIWYIGDKLFQEGVKVDYNGVVISKTVPAEKVEKANKIIKAKIKAFASLVDKKSKEEMIPNAGDCFFCQMKTQDGESLGDKISSDHLTEHFKEKYLTGSLIVNSLQEAGYQDPAVIIGMELKDSIKRAITKYLQKRLLVRI